MFKKEGADGEMMFIPSDYDRNTVEHLVEQLIKLQQESDNRGYNQAYLSKTEITIAMKTINKTLKMVLNEEGE